MSGNESAFPKPDYVNLSETSYNKGKITCSEGLTKREYFAAKAMQGILSCFHDYKGATGVESRAAVAVKHADALIAELEK